MAKTKTKKQTTRENADRHLSVTEARKDAGQTNEATHIKRLLSADLEQVERCARLGFTDKELAYFFGVSEYAVGEAKRQSEPFRLLLEKARVEADAVVVDSLFSLAQGYSYDEVTREAVPVKQADGSVQYEMRVTKIVGKRVIGNVLACLSWLNNRQQDRWRAKQPDLPDGSEAQVETLGSVTLKTELDALLGKYGIGGVAQISEGAHAGK